MLKNLRFPEPFRHTHPPVTDVNEIFEDQLTFGQQAADRVATVMGSWKFVIIQSAILIGWVILNVTAWVNHWDPYPFILMNTSSSAPFASRTR
jgi:uncharacterized membrane protein